MLATFAPLVASMEEEFKQMAERRKASASLETVLVRGAREALVAGELEKHCGLIAEAAKELESCDAIMLAHFSMADAAADARAASGRLILSAPDSAVLKLRSLLTRSSAGQAWIRWTGATI
jgi:hypothetical protein